MNATILTVLIIAMLVVALLGPWFTILALNTLFGLTIELTLGTWAAALWLQFLIVGGLKVKGNTE